MVRRRHGKGAAYLFGFLPGQAYLKSGLPPRPVDRGATDAAFSHFLPTGMDRRLRSRLTEDFLPGDFQRPVEVDREYVEATCLDTPAQGAGPRQRLAVPLINFSAERIESVTVRLPGAAAARQVRSLQHGALKKTTDGENLSVSLPLDVADVLLLDF